jgi:hypothetical protein
MFDLFHSLSLPVDLPLTIVGLAVNFLLIESLQRFYQYYGDELQASDVIAHLDPGFHHCMLQVECPTGSGDSMNLIEVAEEIQHRIIHIFGRDMEGRRATNGDNPRLNHDPHFRDYVWFYEACTHSPPLT